MPIADFITELFCRIDDQLGPRAGRADEKLCRSEVVTIGMLFALKGVTTRAFYRWLSKNYGAFFPRLPERTRLFRRLAHLWEEARAFLAEPTVFGIIDTYGVETIHPRRDGRTENQIGRKGISNHRWIVGAKLAVIVNQYGAVVAWTVMPDNLHDQTFLNVVEAFEQESLVLSDLGFRSRRGTPANLRLCRRGQRPERFLIETVFSRMTTVLHTKKMLQRSWRGLIARLSYTMAIFNLLLNWEDTEKDDHGRTPLSIAHIVTL